MLLRNELDYIFFMNVTYIVEICGQISTHGNHIYMSNNKFCF